MPTEAQLIEAKFAALADALKQKLGAAATAILGSLDQLYPDPAKRLEQLQIICHQQGVDCRSVVAAVTAAVAQTATQAVEETAERTIDLGDAAEAPPKKPAPTKNKATRTRIGRERRWSGKLNRSVYPHWFPVPMASGLGRGAAREQAEEQIDTLFATMPPPALLVYVKACRLADKDGLFDMSAPTARKARGVPTSKIAYGDPYLRLLVEAGLFQQMTSGGAAVGGRRLASEFRLVPYSATLVTQAMQAFTGWREDAKCRSAWTKRAPAGYDPEHARTRLDEQLDGEDAE